jgi:hypothetical protein
MVQCHKHEQPSMENEWSNEQANISDTASTKEWLWITIYEHEVVTIHKENAKQTGQKNDMNSEHQVITCTCIQHKV